MNNFINFIKPAASKIARANPIWVLVACAFLGSLIVIGSLVKEVVYQSDVLTQQGYAALIAYKALVYAHQVSSLREYVVAAFSGELPSVSAPIRGVGYLVLFFISPLAATVVTFAKIVRFAMFDARTTRVA